MIQIIVFVYILFAYERMDLSKVLDTTVMDRNTVVFKGKLLSCSEISLEEATWFTRQDMLSLSC